MANEYGYLQKVVDLGDTQRRQLDTWFAKAYTDDNLFRTLANDPKTLDMFLDWVAAVYATDTDDIDGSLDRHMVELCRIRMANRNECFH